MVGLIGSIFILALLGITIKKRTSTLKKSKRGQGRFERLADDEDM